MKRIIYILCVVFMVLRCSNPSDGTPELGSGFEGRDEPNGVVLVFPEADALCNEGTDLTPTESTVSFEWQPNDNAERYTLTVENLETGVISQYETEDFILPVTIERANPFRWFVNYEFQGETRESAIWNFYNAGPGVQTYPPFPADITAPSMAQTLFATNAVTLQWIGSDVDDDIVGYDVYFGENNPPVLNTSNLAESQLTIAVVPGTFYFWNIVTHDAEGNASESGIHEFRVLE